MARLIVCIAVIVCVFLVVVLPDLVGASSEGRDPVAVGAIEVSATDGSPADASPIDASQNDAPPTVESILARYVEAVGGRETLEGIESRVASGRFIDDRPYAGPVVTSPFEALWKAPDRRLYVEQRGDGEYLEGLEGGSAWRLEDGDLTFPDDVARSKRSWLLDPRGPLRMREYFGEMSLAGSQWLAEHDAEVYVVETDRDAAHYSLHFDAVTGLLLRIGYYWDLTDYRSVDGVRVPHRVTLSRKGGSNTFVFEEIEHNVPIDDARFAVPAKPGKIMKL